MKKSLVCSVKTPLRRAQIRKMSSTDEHPMELSEDKRAALKEWLTSGNVVLQPLTLPQRELWETSPVPVADVANHICCLINIR